MAVPADYVDSPTEKRPGFIQVPISFAG